VTASPPVFDGDGRQTRDLLYIDDAVDALVRASERGSGLVINIGTGEQTSIRDLWKHLESDEGVEPTHRPERPDELARFAVSPVRARIHLAWSPWTDLDTGLNRLRNQS
jgi:UDP-glucose 4-epimerase